MLSRRPPKPAPAFGLHISVRNPWYRASSALARPFPGQTRAHGATNPAKNATFSAPFAQNEGKCCISCNNLEAIGFKTGNIARNVAQNTTLSRECGLFPRFCCAKYNICYHDPGPPAHFHHLMVPCGGMGVYLENSTPGRAAHFHHLMVLRQRHRRLFPKIWR